MLKKIKMEKELKVVLKRINIEKYQKEKPLNINCDNDCEVLVMNYVDDDDTSDDNADTSEFIPKEEANIPVKFENEELCDVDTKQTILVKFEENVNDAEKAKKKTKNSNCLKRKLVCDECGFRAEKKHHLQSHIIQAHQNKKDVPKEFECEYCMYKSRWKHAVVAHKGSFHMDELQKEGSSQTKPKKSCYDVRGTNAMDHCTQDENKNYLCNYCSHSTASKILILKHIVCHVVNKSEVFQCPECPKRFLKQAFLIHQRKEHYDGFVCCPKCSYQTKWTNNLRRHLKQNKDKEKCAPVQKRKPRRRAEDTAVKIESGTSEGEEEDSE